MDGEESLCGKALVPVSDNELLQGISPADNLRGGI